MYESVHVSATVSVSVCVMYIRACLCLCALCTFVCVCVCVRCVHSCVSVSVCVVHICACLCLCAFIYPCARVGACCARVYTWVYTATPLLVYLPSITHNQIQDDGAAALADAVAHNHTVSMLA